MRGDRLLKLLLLLQSRGKMKADEIGKELEVSERTVYRDLEALEFAGVPLVTERGPQGGCSLLEGYSTRLTGLKAKEAAALFASGIPEAMRSLGLESELEGALLKLAAALPAGMRKGEDLRRERIYIDSGPGDSADCLGVLRDAVLESRKVRIVRRLPYSPVPDTSLVLEAEALGLVASGKDWFLAAGFKARQEAINLKDVSSAEALDATFSYPEDFVLGPWWRRERERRAELASSFKARLSILPSIAPYLRPRFGTLVESLVAGAGTPDARGMVRIELGFHSLEEALFVLPGLGGAVRVEGPELLRTALEDRALACASAQRR